MDVHLRDLRYFVAVAEELSFSRGAERLYVSQPALSKQIRVLEAGLGATLLTRDRRHVELTPAGHALLARARDLLAEWEVATNEVERLTAQTRTILSVGLLTSLGRDLYPSVLRRFGQLQPGWRLQLRTRDWSDATVGLADRSSDVAFVWLPVDDARIKHAVLFTEQRWVALSRHHRLAERAHIDFADLLDEPFIALPESAGSLRDFWLALDSRDGRPPRIAAVAGGPDEKFELVASGLAVTLLAEGNAAVYVRPDVVCRPVLGLEPCQLAVAWRGDDRRSAVRAFVRACLDVAPDLRPG